MRYLVDTNLPFKTKIWQTQDFKHQVLINDKESDSKIWNFAKKMNLVILTKDNDFMIKILKSNPPPKVVLFKVGNMKFSKFDEYLSKNWNNIENEINFNKLVIAHLNSIETIK